MIKIAFVEDEVRNHFTFEQHTILLNAHGIENGLTIYATGEQALEGIAANVPDIVFMNVRLPGISGLDVTRKLRSNKATKTVPIIALTAYALPLDWQAALEAGCNDYLAKPIHFSAIEETVRRFLTKDKSSGRTRQPAGVGE